MTVVHDNLIRYRNRNDKGLAMKFHVYAHLQGTNVKYIGCGNESRPYDFYRRNINWLKLFSKQNPPKVIILETCDDKNKAEEREKHYIKTFKDMGHELANKPTSRYWLGKTRDPEIMRRMNEASRTPEAREKQRLAKIGKTHTEEHKLKISEALKNVERPKEWGEAISNAKKGKSNGLKGRVMSESHRKAISEATKGRRPLTAEEQQRRLATWKERGMTSSKSKAVRCINTDQIFRCAKDAAKELGGSDKGIQRCCTGVRETHNNLRWEYV